MASLANAMAFCMTNCTIPLKTPKNHHHYHCSPSWVPKCQVKMLQSWYLNLCQAEPLSQAGSTCQSSNTKENAIQLLLSLNPRNPNVCTLPAWWYHCHLPGFMEHHPWLGSVSKLCKICLICTTVVYSLNQLHFHVATGSIFGSL